jgi:hypothetical protein
MRSRVRAMGVCLTAGAMLSGCGAGAVSPSIQTGRADVNAAGDGGSIVTNDWTYGLPAEGVTWVDAQGTVHDGGRVACLAPGTSREVQFAAVEVQVGGTTWRPVVWLSCK